MAYLFAIAMSIEKQEHIETNKFLFLIFYIRTGSIYIYINESNINLDNYIFFKKRSNQIFDRIRNIELKDWSFVRTTYHVMPRVIVSHSLPGKY